MTCWRPAHREMTEGRFGLSEHTLECRKLYGDEEQKTPAYPSTCNGRKRRKSSKLVNRTP